MEYCGIGNIMWTYNNELYHYGVLGMKWGVRKTLKNASPKTYFSSISTAERINKVAKDKGRVADMSKRQRKSLKKAQTYWNARAAGKATPHRGFIRREVDRYRSYEFGSRAKSSLGNATLANIGNIHKARRVYDAMDPAIRDICEKPSYATLPIRAVTGTGVTLGLQWVANRVFGHF